MSSSWWITVMPGTGSATTSRVALAGDAGSTTSSMSPALTRWLLPTFEALTLTPPSAARSAARVRERPNRRAIAASTRSPSRPSGTRTVRASAIRVLRVVHGPGDGGAREGEHHDDPRRDDDRDVGDVAHEPAEVVDEVDDVASARPRRAEEPVDEVAERTAEQQPEGDGPGQVAHLAGTDDHPDDDRQRHDGEDPRGAVAQREGGAGVAHEVEPDRVADDVHGLPRRERAQRPDLGQLVQQQGEGGEPEHDGIQPPPAAGR